MKIKIIPLFASFLLVSACAGEDTGGSDLDFSQPIEEEVFNEPVLEQSIPVEEVFVEATGTLDDFIINAGDRVFFALNSYDISSDSQNTLERQADWLNQFNNVSITIEGHCDERGTREYNLALGERRANAVRDYLISLGVSAFRIDIKSYGEEQPAVPGSNESAWSLNRRAVTQLSGL